MEIIWPRAGSVDYDSKMLTKIGTKDKKGSKMEVVGVGNSFPKFCFQRGKEVVQ